MFHEREERTKQYRGRYTSRVSANNNMAANGLNGEYLAANLALKGKIGEERKSASSVQLCD